MKIAVVGASGAVGREMLSELYFLLKRLRIKAEVFAFASSKSAGTWLDFGPDQIRVEEYELAKLEGFSFALLSAGSTFSRAQSPAISELGVRVIDNSSAFRGDESFSLIVPEVNGQELLGGKVKKGIIANPNCSTIQLVVCLKPLQDVFGLAGVWVSSYQSVSGTGQNGIAELLLQEKSAGHRLPSVYSNTIYNNVLSFIGAFDEQGHCEEEQKIVRESRRLLSAPSLPVFAHTARVPVTNCHCESVTVELQREVELSEILAVFEKSESIVLERVNEAKRMPSPKEWTGQRKVSVSRVRLPFGEKVSRFVSFWNISDNLKKGAATNAVQILERLL